jgi:hypothetical protein
MLTENLTESLICYINYMFTVYRFNSLIITLSFKFQQKKRGKKANQ